MKNYDNLREYFDHKIEPAIPRLKREYEIYFQSAKNQILRRMNWVMVILLAIVIGLRFFRPEMLPSNMLGLTIFVLIAYFLMKYVFVDVWVKNSEGVKVFILKFKQKMVKPILHAFDTSLQLFPESCIDTDILYKSGLFYPRDEMRIKGEDLVKGTYEGMKLQFSEMHITLYQRGNKRHINFFDGLFLEATLPKSLNGVVYLITSSAFSGPMDLFKMKIFRDEGMTKEEQKAHNMNISLHASNHYSWDMYEVEKEIGVKLDEIFVYDENTGQEDEMIRQQFKVFADNPSSIDRLWTETRIRDYLFTYKEDEAAMDEVVDTPSFEVIDNKAIGRLMRRYFSIGIVNDKVYLAVPFTGKNLFDPNWSDNFLSFENVEEMYEELNNIFNFLDAIGGK